VLENIALYKPEGRKYVFDTLQDKKTRRQKTENMTKLFLLPTCVSRHYMPGGPKKVIPLF